VKVLRVPRQPIGTLPTVDSMKANCQWHWPRASTEIISIRYKPETKLKLIGKKEQEQRKQWA